MKFRFRLSSLMRQRKIDQDLAQREYASAQKAVRDQMDIINNLYVEMDSAREKSENLQSGGGACINELTQIEEFIDVQKIKIFNSRQHARELMQKEEEKHEVLTEKMRAFKILEKLREKQSTEFKKIRNKIMAREVDDIVTMRFIPKEKL